MAARREKKEYRISPLQNQVLLGDALQGLRFLPEESVDLIMTSPEPFQAERETDIQTSYAAYLEYMRKVIRECARVLADGRFMAVTASHVLIPRRSRSESSLRIAVTFDLHRIFVEEGFVFVDDIILRNADGSGRMTGRGSRFSVDRNPLQYKPQPVTEYLMVYRKGQDVLIDTLIHDHPQQELVEQSRIPDGYEKTNIWNIHADPEEKYSARFPRGLAERVVQYYSFMNDVVLDPFAGIGITARTAAEQKRRFCMIEKNAEIADYMMDDLRMRGSSFIHPFEFSFTDLRKEDSHAQDGV